MPRKPVLQPCPDCGIGLMRHKGGPHGLAHHECVAVTPASRVRVHREVTAALTQDILHPSQARSLMLKLLVMRAWEEGSTVKELGEVLDKLGDVSGGGAVVPTDSGGGGGDSFLDDMVSP